MPSLHPTDQPGRRPPFAELAPVSRQAACEGMVLLRNEDRVLPLAAGERVALFGRCQVDTYRSGTGSGGAVNVPYAVNILQGLRANPRLAVDEELAAVYTAWIAEHPFDDGGGGWAAEPWFQQEMPLTDALVARAAARSGVAVVVIGRTAGEEKDCADRPGSYRLTGTEEAMLAAVTARFCRVVVVLNTTNIVDMSWLDTMPAIKAVLYCWAAGMEGGHALADILSGAVSPSGRLADTVVRRLEDHPASAHFGDRSANCYAEDIYVGYRYFETFRPRAVRYPFGAGLSYASFAREAAVLSTEGAGAGLLVHVDLTVRNTGATHPGKEVVQLYAEAPQGRLGKPARVLAAFAKTAALAPGATQALRLSVPLASLASYDDGGAAGHRSCFVLEAGAYRFHLGGSVREARPLAAAVTLAETVVVRRLEEALAPVRAFGRLRPGERGADGAYREEREPAPLRRADLARRIAERLPAGVAPTGDRGLRLADVRAGRAAMADFVAQMAPEDLAALVRGEGMCSPKATPGTAAAFGGTTPRLLALGIPVAAAADGPSGLRLDSGHQATQVPVGTLLACTWNEALNEELFRLVGEELRAYRVDTLLGPGINLHRHPLNGRNFEYFSEDPVLAGTMAAAQVRGLARAGVAATIKHFAANDQETARHDADSVASERCLREVHLRPFEMAVRQGGARSVMTSYNPVNGHWGASNYDLCTTVLRGEWGFDGVVMSDWWAKMNHNVTGGPGDRAATSCMVRAQNDLYMVVADAAANPHKDDTLAALADGRLTLGELQRAAANICRFLMASPAMERPLVPFDPVKRFAARGGPPGGTAAALAEGVAFRTRTDATALLRVAEEGVYQVVARARNPRDAAAQSACSLFLNGEFAMSLPLNGTGGRWVEVRGVPLRLERGFYELALVFVKPGMEVERLDFVREEA